MVTLNPAYVGHNFLGLLQAPLRGVTIIILIIAEELIADTNSLVDKYLE